MRGVGYSIFAQVKYGNTLTVADYGERFAASFLSVPPAFIMRKDEAKTSPQIMPDITRRLTLTRQRHKTGMDIFIPR